MGEANGDWPQSPRKSHGWGEARRSPRTFTGHSQPMGGCLCMRCGGQWQRLRSNWEGLLRPNPHCSCAQQGTSWHICYLQNIVRGTEVNWIPSVRELKGLRGDALHANLLRGPWDREEDGWGTADHPSHLPSHLTPSKGPHSCWVSLSHIEFGPSTETWPGGGY